LVVTSKQLKCKIVLPSWCKLTRVLSQKLIRAYLTSAG